MIPENAKEKFINFQKQVAESLDNAISNFNTQILFIPMYKGPGQEDDRICKDIASMMQKGDGIFHLPTDLTCQEVQSVISTLNLVIGVRMHALILSASCGVPFIGINYAPKGTSFCKMMGMDDYSILAEELDKNWLQDKIKKFQDENTHLRKSLLKKKEEILNSLKLEDFI